MSLCISPLTSLLLSIPSKWAYTAAYLSIGTFFGKGLLACQDPQTSRVL